MKDRTTITQSINYKDKIDISQYVETEKVLEKSYFFSQTTVSENTLKIWKDGFCLRSLCQNNIEKKKNE